MNIWEQADSTKGDRFLSSLRFGMLRQARVNALRELHSQTQAEVEALLPSILDKAFKGGL
jgi:hypothetical protein